MLAYSVFCDSVFTVWLLLLTIRRRRFISNSRGHQSVYTESCLLPTKKKSELSLCDVYLSGQKEGGLKAKSQTLLKKARPEGTSSII